MSSKLAPVIALSHGGGPMPLLNEPRHAAITNSLRTRVPKLLKLGTPEAPKAIVLVTAHWSEDVPYISGSDKHQLYYDYSGFPPETYKLKYDAPGSSEIAKDIKRAFEEVGLQPEVDYERGWDHGVFVPMTLINPPADVPIVQISVLSSEDPAQHYLMGRALHQLRSQNIAIIGSGFASCHNMRNLLSGSTSDFKARNVEWSDAVTKAAKTKDDKEREQEFRNWREWPNSYLNHPRGGAEHFLPLIVAAGAAGDQGAEEYADEFMGLQMWSYFWQ